MSAETMVLLILLIVLVGALPSWPYSQAWGYYPSGAALVLAAVLIVWMLARQTGTGDLTQDTRSAVQDLGHDVKRDMRNATDNIRKAIDPSTANQ